MGNSTQKQSKILWAHTQTWIYIHTRWVFIYLKVAYLKWYLKFFLDNLIFKDLIGNGLINLTQIATWHFPKGVDFEGLQIICQIISVITYSNKKVGYGGQGNTQVGIRAIPSTYAQKKEAFCIIRRILFILHHHLYNTPYISFSILHSITLNVIFLPTPTVKTKPK